MVQFIRSDLDFILQQILLAEAHAAGSDPKTLVPNSFVPFGLRTVDGSFNNLFADQSEFGASDNIFPRLTDPVFRDAQAGTSYAQTSGTVIDSQPRTISNLIVDQSLNNPAAIAAALQNAGSVDIAGDSASFLAALQALETAKANAGGNTSDPAVIAAQQAFDQTVTDLGLNIAASPGLDGQFGTADDKPVFFIPNTTPDEGLSAPFNSWFTFFGQFFDHGLDLVTKGGNDVVFIPLQPDDPLFVEGSPTNFMVLTRATQFAGPGANGILNDDPTTAVDESADNTTHEAMNTTSPFVDQNQTYSSHPSHQVFLRAYELDANGRPVPTGKLITNRDLGADGIYGTADDEEIGGMATWAVVKAQARDILGINLTDADALRVPLLATDAYGNFIGGQNGFPQLVVAAGPPPVLVEGNPALPVNASQAISTGHGFLDDIAHAANPFGDHDGNPATPPQALTPDVDTVAGGTPPEQGFYDNELLDAHYIAGDGRVNENIGLTAVHSIFHAEHNRLADHTKEVLVSDAQTLLAGGATQAEAVAFLNQWLVVDVLTVPALTDIATLQWDGERLFQVAKFGTEMQYQHLVFEEFARKVQPQVDAFLAPEGFDTTIDPAIVAEFAHTVYRFGHSMLTETIDRLDPNFVSNEVGLIAAFLNPLAFAASGPTPEEATGAIVRGVTRQAGNEIDEFVTEALRNNLLGLPLDLPTINLARGRDTGVPSLNAARREFYEMTSDSQLKPYTSWVDLVQNLKHPESVINFIAAYGTHTALTAADVDTLAEKRAVASALVLGGSAVINAGGIAERTFIADEADRLAFLNSTGIYANSPTGVTTTGVDAIDLWVGGLAERQMPFGGLLGSTFNFVFETQLEALQNGDRFYYLARTAGMNFLTELENNSFAKLIMANSDATHLPADVFSTPGLILEVDQTRQFNANVVNDPGPDGILGDDPLTPLVDESADDIATPNQDPLGGSALIPLVIRDNPATAVVDTNFLHYTGEDHVVLGGTENDDIIISSIGDDTLLGDGGNDRLEGGDGVDNIEGGAGDDIITDLGGDDVLKGNDGDDVIHGGNGFNLILGGGGSDFIITGEDVSETFGGTGNDFILGAQMNLPTFGNEGDDWIEIGTSDGAGGDNFDPQEASTVIGHDVFITGGGFDEVDGEGGDDIMVMSDGEDHFGGGGGFDWASYKNDAFGVTVDLNVNDFVEPPVTPSNQGILDRFAQVEGLTGSAFGDILRGDDADAAEINVAGPQNSALTNISLINDLQAFLDQILSTTGVTSFSAGNIILGGSGSDIIEGRGGDDLIDGDRWLNVRISVTGHTPQPGQPVITSVDSLTELVPYVLSGEIKPGQLSIVREINTGDADFDTAVFSDNRANYTVVTSPDGVTTVTHNLLDGNGVVIGVDADGADRLLNVERLQFADQSVTLVAGLNNDPVGLLVLDDLTPAVNQVLTASTAGVTDADNPGTGEITGPISIIWQSEAIAGSGIFQDIVDFGGGNPGTALGNTFRITPDLDGLRLRAKAVYQDANGVLETVFSAPTVAVAAGAPAAAPAPIPAETPVTSAGIHLIRSDLQFILEQILIAEAHSGAYGTPAQDLRSLLPNTRLPFGLRTVDGSFNNLVQGQSDFGAADQNFPSLLDQQFRNDQDGDTFDANGPAPGGLITNTNYASTTNVVDADPRIISNLIVDQTITNPVAVEAFVAAGLGTLDVNGVLLDLNGVPIPAGQPLFVPNTAPDEGLSAGFNGWFTFFGQFFDHGLDLVNKGGNGTIFVPLQPDDPLYVEGSPTNFMVLSRATNTLVQAGADGVLGTADDIHRHNNQTTPFVDQNQTYTSHPSHQVFLREYALDANNHPIATGQLLDGADGGLPTWANVKAQALMLGITLTDADVTNLPMVATDPYGKFIPGANGLAQFVTAGGLVEGVAGGLAVPVDVVRTNHAFLDDIAHSANPRNSAGALLTADADTGIGDDNNAGTYDNELLDRHFITGDGRGNENIGLTTVHHIFHSEHNRMVQHTKDVVLASNDPAFIAQWQLPDGSWNGERLFQAARFATEMQYQHLVFEEFARKVQPQVDVFLAEGQGYDATINPAIVAEFAHVVYRFGHSMLTETVNRLDPNFQSSEIGLIEAFLNPVAFNNDGALTADQAAGAIVRGMTRQAGNEIDEFVTEALRNNLLGLPLDLPSINLMRGRDTGVPSLNAARREFYDATGDGQLKPYASWVELAANLKHESSVVNFIAAYGTHAALTAADVDTLAERRAVAAALVLGGSAVINAGGITERTFVADEADRLAFLNSTGIYANSPTGVTTTGVDAIDLWVGGLAERQMPFGGLLGSTFNFVFENQMEKLQNGDRFYYLERTAGLNFLTELENNSFAKLIMANTDATHLPGDVFSTPGFTLEVDQTKQFTELNEAGADGIQGTADDVAGLDGISGNSDPLGGILLTPLVIRDNPATPGADTDYLRYTGEDHVVLGGTAGDDTIIASIGDDTLYGDAGNDRLEGGDGVDMILGGAGDDIITDLGGDDNLQGGDGNDAIHAGNGINLMLGGFGNDFIVTGEDSNEAFGGPGNDFIFGTRADEMVFGNEGDDWIEHGMADGSAGENFDTRGLDSIIGNDVFIGDSVADRMLGEGGDDIMVGNGGQVDRYIGGSGFDWAVFKHDSLAANVDLNLRAFDETPVPLTAASALARFESAEGLSGSSLSDILRGDDADAGVIASSGFTGSVLTNFGLVTGLQQFVGAAAAGSDGIVGTADDQFGSGNIILGGDGSDLIEGRGGDDLIDGDLSLNVRISVRANANGTGEELFSADSMSELTDRVFSGEINPGQLTIVREILTADGPGFDTAVFSDVLANYRFNGQVFDPANLPTPDINGFITVSHIVGGVAGPDGTDRLSNIERLRFSDQSIVLGGINSEPVGLLSIRDAATGTADNTPSEGQLLEVSIAGVSDADNPDGLITGPVTYFWQFEPRPGTGIFEDIIIATGLGDVHATGPTFTPGADLAGLALRVRAIYQDANGVLEEVFSAPTVGVGLEPPPPNTVVGTRGDETLNGGAGDDIINADRGNDIVNGGGGNDTIDAGRGADTVDGGDGNDTILGDRDNDILNGGAGDDNIDGGRGDDTINGGLGNDTILGDRGNDLITVASTEGRDIIDGGRDTDTVRIVGDASAEAFRVYARLDAIAAGITVAAATEIVITRGAAVVAELANIEEIQITGGGGGDTFQVIGNFAATTLFTNTITIDGSTGNDTVDISTLTSAHRIVFKSNGGHDTIIGTLRPQDVIELAPGSTLADYTSSNLANGTTILSNGDHTITFPTLPNGASPTFAPLGSGGGSGDDDDDGDPVGGDDDGDNNGGGGDDDGDDDGQNGGGDDDDDDNSSGGDDDDDDDTSSGGDDDDDDGSVPLPVAARTLIGTAAADVLIGAAGDDVVLGGGGGDIVVGDAGNDILRGEDGDDVVTAGDGNDSVTGGAGDDELHGGAGDDMLFGNAGKDMIHGEGGSDFIEGGAGDDQIWGGAGDDGIIASASDGDDQYWGGEGVDTLDYAVASANLTVDLGNGFMQRGQVSGGSTGTDVVYGFENVITGSGHDTITATAAVNVMDGGLGNDTFRFLSAAAADGDTIHGFQPGDKIDFAAIDANTGSAGVQHFSLVSGGSLTAAGQVVVTHEVLDGNEFTVIHGNVDSNSDADFVLMLKGNYNLTESDFNGVS